MYNAKLSTTHSPSNAVDDDTKCNDKAETILVASVTKAEANEPVPSARRPVPPFVDEFYTTESDEENHYHEDGDFGEPEAVLIAGPDRRAAMPGAVRITGIDGDLISQHSILYGEREEEKYDSDNAASVQSRVEAEVVDDDKLFDEVMTRRRNDVLEAEVKLDLGYYVKGDDDVVKNEKCFTANKRTITAATIALAVVIVIAVVVTAVLVSQSNTQSKQQSHGPSTTISQPTAISATLLQAFRLVILNQNVTSNQDLDQQESPQYKALNWLANETFLNESASAETIIDRYVLALIYFADDGYHWKNQSGFLTFDSVCAWHSSDNQTGAFCNTAMDTGSNRLTNYFLTKLVLASNSLKGTIPTELGQLSNLVYLDFQNNQLSGAIPPELRRMSNLTYLGLDTNKFTGAITTEFGRLSSLTYFALESNQIGGTIPSELGQLSDLTYLNLGINHYNGTIPTELGQLSYLTYLDLHRNQLRGTIPTELERLSKLNHFDLNTNHLMGSIVTVLVRLSNLAFFAIESNDISGVVLPTELAQLSNLTYLNLGGSANQVTGSIPTDLGLLSKLTSLIVVNNILTGTIPFVLGQLSKLTTLNLEGNALNGTIPTELGHLTSLTYLGLGFNEVGGTIPAELRQLSNLNLLDLSNNKLSGAVPTFLATLINLDSLYLNQNRNLTGNLTAIFCNNRSWDALEADCKSGTTECSCCTQCY